jgi:hypothetical protein
MAAINTTVIMVSARPGTRLPSWPLISATHPPNDAREAAEFVRAQWMRDRNAYPARLAAKKIEASRDRVRCGCGGG